MTRKNLLLLGLCLLALLIAGYSFAAEPMSQEQRRRAEQMTSFFENSSITFQYAYIEHLNDGRGYTAGRIGFTTATGDLFVLVQRYCAGGSSPAICSFLPVLATLAERGSGNIVELGDSFVAAWKSAALDEKFCHLQDAINEEMYFLPAMVDAQNLGVQSALGKAILYDALIQHGNGVEYDGLLGMAARATAKLGGNPATGNVTEADWLAGFLSVRREDLLHPANDATRLEWAESVERVDFFQDLLIKKNFDLVGPIQMDPDTVSSENVIP